MKACVLTVQGYKTTFIFSNLWFWFQTQFRFISNQVGPMHEMIGSDVNIKFVPYGFADVGINNKKYSYLFTLD